VQGRSISDGQSKRFKYDSSLDFETIQTSLNHGYGRHDSETVLNAIHEMKFVPEIRRWHQFLFESFMNQNRVANRVCESSPN
jgi:hypothetical protein